MLEFESFVSAAAGAPVISVRGTSWCLHTCLHFDDKKTEQVKHQKWEILRKSDVQGHRPLKRTGTDLRLLLKKELCQIRRNQPLKRQ